MKTEKTIGIISGVGPFAGLDLLYKIFDQTKAIKDQDHVPVILISAPGKITDRTAFLLGKDETNPADAIIDLIATLKQAGADVIGIPCVTMHAPKIFDKILNECRAKKIEIKIINLINVIFQYIEKQFPLKSNLGILCTLGTGTTCVFDSYMQNQKYHLTLGNEKTQAEVHDAIYNLGYGLKSNPKSKRAKEILHKCAKKLIYAGAEIIILGCTETPLAFTEHKIGDTYLIDPNLLLARALLQYIAPDKIKPDTQFE